MIGRVQGVGFRYFALRRGMDLGLEGWVANETDGSVRTRAEGPRRISERFLADLGEGPPAAIVDRVIAAWSPPTGTWVRSRSAAAVTRATERAVGRPPSRCPHRRGPVGRLGYFARDHRRPWWVAMETYAWAEELPALYRQILDRVALLESAGDRAGAARVRVAATKAYSRAWDDRARRELEALLRRAQRPTAAERMLGRRTGRATGRGFRLGSLVGRRPDRTRSRRPIAEG